MKMQGRFGLATAVLLVIPTFSQAQRATGNFRAAPSAPASAPAVHNTAVRAHSGNRSANGHAVRPSPLIRRIELGAQFWTAWFRHRSTVDAADTGSSIEHLDSISRMRSRSVTRSLRRLSIRPHSRGLRSPSDAREGNRRTANGFIFLDGGGAYVLPAEPGTDLNPDADAQTAQDQGQDQEQGTRQERAPQESQQQEQLEANNERLALEQSESLPDEGEFTLILRSGQEIEAVAFTRVDDRIVYITTGGGRHTVAVRELDVDATVRLNQERGTPLQIPL